jgi:hypothetical protein
VLVPPGNAPLIADAIPGAELRTYAGAAHLYFTDEPQVDRDVLDWLSGRTSRGPSSPGRR